MPHIIFEIIFFRSEKFLINTILRGNPWKYIFLFNTELLFLRHKFIYLFFQFRIRNIILLELYKRIRFPKCDIELLLFIFDNFIFYLFCDILVVVRKLIKKISLVLKEDMLFFNLLIYFHVQGVIMEFKWRKYCFSSFWIRFWLFWTFVYLF
jgi:hypothetical protein